MKKIKSCSNAVFVKRLDDGKIIQTRCCKVKTEQTDDFDIVFEVLSNGKWIAENNVCSPNFTFCVPKQEMKGF